LELRRLLSQGGQVCIFHEHIVAQEAPLQLATHQFVRRSCELFLGLMAPEIRTADVLSRSRDHLRGLPEPFACCFEGLAKAIMLAPVPVQLTVEISSLLLKATTMALDSME